MMTKYFIFGKSGSKIFYGSKLSQSAKNILKFLSEQQVDAVLLDMNFRKGFENGQDGLYWMQEIKTLEPQLPIILMTAYGEVELAVEALKNGASDFILKPWNNEKLYASVNLAVDISRKNKKLNQWENINIKTNQYQLETQSPAMQEVMDKLKEFLQPTPMFCFWEKTEPENMFWQSTFTNYRKEESAFCSY
jgi:DNA-binding NtrC family response regulator